MRARDHSHAEHFSHEDLAHWHYTQTYITPCSHKMLTEDIVHIQQLICREREARDRSWWNEMRATWAEDPYVNVSWYSGPGPGFVDGSQKMQSKNAPVKHRLGPILVRVNDNRAVATVSVTISTRVWIEGAEADLRSDARLLYRTVKARDVWLLTRLDCI